MILRWLINARITVAEKRMGVPLDYLRYILKVSLQAFHKFTRIMPLAHYRRKLPAAAYHVARLVTVRHDDCGTCVQIEVNLAKREGISKEVLQTVLDSKVEALPAELQVVYRFAEAVATQSGADVELRPVIIQQYGERGLVEMAMGMGVSRIFPTTKRALGFAVSCSKVKVEV